VSIAEMLCRAGPYVGLLVLVLFSGERHGGDQSGACISRPLSIPSEEQIRNPEFFSAVSFLNIVVGLCKLDSTEQHGIVFKRLTHNFVK
jgi:hypothetical protein